MYFSGKQEHRGDAAEQRPHLGLAWQHTQGRPRVLGHRGASAHHPENTLAAFAGAMDAGADGIELDVRLCASGELVVFHDQDLERLCGDSRTISSLSWDELSTLRVGGESIPVLEQVLEHCPEALINIELKQHPMRQAMALVTATLRAIHGARALHRVLVSSFDPRLLATLRVMEPSIPRALIFHRTQGLVLRRGWLARGLAVSAVHPEHTLIDASTLGRWHDRKVPVNCWTLDDPERIRYLAMLGVDGIICNDPAAALAALGT